MIKNNVLVYPCSTGIGMEIYNSLKNIKHLTLFGLDSSLRSKGYYLYENFSHFVPYTDNKFIDNIKTYIKLNNIDIIIPADDNAVIIFKEYEHLLNVIVVTSPYETSMIARSKQKTYECLKNAVSVPKLYSYEDSNIIYPVYIKPDNGAGNVNSFKINNYTELSQKIDNTHIICEYLPGKEYTVECLTDKKGKLLCCIPRERTVVSNGLSIGTKLILHDAKILVDAELIANKINDTLKFIGSWFFQVKYNSANILTLLEISTRIPGASNILTNYGINMCLLSIYIHLNKDVSISHLDVNELETLKIYKNYYDVKIEYDNVYIDFDDTLILNDKVNLDIICFIYKAINKKKNIYLITRHRHNLDETMNKYKLSSNMFNEIYLLQDNQSKNSFIKNNSIFIDDSFAERLSIDKNKNIYCFDTANIDILLNNKNI